MPNTSLIQVIILGLGAIGAGSAAAWLLRSRRRKPVQRRPTKKGVDRRRQARLRAVAAATPCKAVPRYGSLKTADPNQFSLLSWNVLADGLSDKKRLPMVLPGHTGWHHRAPLIREELHATAPDLVALQEVDPSRWEEMRAWLPGYESLLQDKKEESKMLLGLMWKPRLQLVWAEHRSLVMLAEFSFNDGAGNLQTLYLMNLHLEGSPYRPNDRISQLKSGLLRMTARQEANGMQPSTCSTLVCGDFNSGPENCPYRLMHRGRLEGGSTEAGLPQIEVTRTSVSHPYKLYDAYMESGDPLPWTRKVPGRPATLDYIWATSDLDLVAVYHPLKGLHGQKLATSCRGLGGLPNSLCPSDHLPLGATFRLRSPALS
ncbi:Endonuclease/exonuclease/phosphatase [Dunaliella salina]|uniref:Endonuclease/exonuclease/phosphatase n=1 Tax=Dunaliella salina TaxID=3046 RepID=A0ABQ7H847_DUNSA|nr:Endonuclease/exonuclease/phosphatase [Dunaliella salina]|eukprot:KAF5843031.1 Endonuclease/exonuclease/phosphatase [Dunaliella salina]